ncbi:hypothetical protein SADUNF_Sadunf01G0064700 [Salix dunnii]|uniref:Uncharacterized protein n=1 Tax=Salix dunnii TaxID=1413687 RepID=A0A835TME2_9ROSI|nr:hypothetical protein SADUNF_Sadunf01G0064700 [Salix dunnii]
MHVYAQAVNVDDHIHTLFSIGKKLKILENINRGLCRAQLSDDTTFAAAIGVCVLSSLLFPNTVTKDEEAESYSGITTTDTRFAVIGVMSFIPYFDWPLEASIRNGDIHGFQLFSEAAKGKNENTGICHLLKSYQEMRLGSGESKEITQKIKHTQMEVGVIMLGGGNNRTAASWLTWLGKNRRPYDKTAWKHILALDFEIKVVFDFEIKNSPF